MAASMNLGPLVGWVAVGLSIAGIAGGTLASFTLAQHDIGNLKDGRRAQGVLLAQLTEKQHEQEGTLRVLDQRFKNVERDIDRIDRTIREDRAAADRQRRVIIDAVNSLSDKLADEDQRQ